jgi:hypothetical protein
MNRLIPSGIALVALLSAAPAFADDVGRVDELVNTAYGTPPSETRTRVEHADGVVMNELLETDPQSALKVIFIDGSELTLGENSSAVIDEYVYSGGQGNSNINLVKGAFRYISGEMPKENVEIETPTVTMGIRGTDLRIKIGDDGTTRLVVKSGEAFIKSFKTGSEVKVPSGFEIMADKFGNFTKVAPAGQGNAPKSLGSKIGDVAIDENLQNAKEKYEYAELTGPGFDVARTTTIAAMTSNTSHIGSPQGYANWQNRYNEQPSGVITSDAPVEESEWVVTQGTASLHYASGTTYGPITAPEGGVIDSLNNDGQVETIMVKEFTMGINQNYLSLEGVANFVTTEYPNFVGSQYNDDVTIIVTTPGGVSTTVTLAQLFGASVNASTFTPVSGLPFPMIGPSNVPPDSGGQTGWEAFFQKMRVAPGGKVRIEVHVRNATDTAYPSAALVAGIKANGGQ